MVEKGIFTAKVMAASSEDWAEGTCKGDTICRFVLNCHLEFNEWLTACQVTLLDGKTYKVKRVIANGCRFGNDELVFEVTIGVRFLRKETMLVLVTRKET